MIKIQIKTVFGSLLFEYESENNTILETLQRANLRGVNLESADLRGADLRGANLQGASMVNVNTDGAMLNGAIWTHGRPCTDKC